MTEHALLSPSSAERWLVCPASIRLIAEMTHPPESSPYAEEGTQAHTLAYLKAALHFEIISFDQHLEELGIWSMEVPEELHGEMEEHADAYVQLLTSIVDQRTGPITVLLEQKLATGIDQCWGTGDAIILSDGYVDVVDFKYGQGVAVSAIDNPQLKLYGVGALDTFGIINDAHTVTVHIHQPRLNSYTSQTLSADELRAWRDSIVPIAEEALSPDAHFGPSATACRFCPVAGDCRARMQHVLDSDFGPPDLMTPDELSDALDRVGSIKSWCTALEAAALKRAYSDGVPLPRWKVVLSGGRRSIPEEKYDEAVSALASAGYDEDLVTRTSLQTLGYLEKLVGKKELPTILGSALVAGEGKPSLVPEDDKRPAIDATAAAVKDFSSSTGY